MRFQGIFLAVVLATALVVAAFLVHGARPERDRARPTAAHVTATGECALCHRREAAATACRRSAGSALTSLGLWRLEGATA